MIIDAINENCECAYIKIIDNNDSYIQEIDNDWQEKLTWDY